jgi:ketosteroid isomerase-like protein
LRRNPGIGRVESREYRVEIEKIHHLQFSLIFALYSIISTLIMKSLLYLLLLLPALLFAQTNKDESNIKSVLNTQITLWNAGDVKGFMEYYEKSPNLKFIGKSGVVAGWEATLARYLKSYPNRETMGTLDFDIQEIDVTAGKTAWVLGKWHLTRPTVGDAGGYFTLLMKKVKGKWLVVRDHTS